MEWLIWILESQNNYSSWNEVPNIYYGLTETVKYMLNSQSDIVDYTQTCYITQRNGKKQTCWNNVETDKEDNTKDENTNWIQTLES
jgi:hypothetical protein